MKCARGGMPSMQWLCALALAVTLCLNIPAVESLRGEESVTSRHLLELNDHEQSWRDKIVSQRTSVLLTDWKGNSVEHEFDLDNEDYLDALVVLGLAGFIPCSVCFLVACYYVFRPCVCKGETKQVGGYSFRRRAIPTLAVVLSIIACLGLAIPCYLGNNWFDDGLRLFMHRYTDKAHSIDSYVIELDSNITALDARTSMSEKLGWSLAVSAYSNTFKTCSLDDLTTANDNESLFTKWNFDRWCLINVANVFGIFTATLGIAALYLKKGWISFWMAVFAFLTLFFTWIAFGFHLPIGVMNADFCVKLEEFLKTKTNNGAVEHFVHCMPQTCFQKHLDFAVGGREMAVKELSVTTVDLIGQSVTVDNYTTVESRPEIQGDNFAVLLLQTVKAFEGANLAFDDLISCDSVYKMYDELESPVCYDMLIGLNLVLASEGTIGILLLFGAWGGVQGIRKFEKNIKNKNVRELDDLNELQQLFGEAQKQDKKKSKWKR